jgi:hypothetical protein
MRQRTPPDPDRLAPVAPWRPAPVAGNDTGGAASFGGGTTARGPDWYVVVDELDELGCRLAVDRWPDRDADGRLVFDDGERLVSVPPGVLHAAVTAARAAHGEPAPDRPLRIGDTFAWWQGPLARELRLDGVPPRAPDIGRSEQDPDVEVVDVTREARLATNAAAQATAGGVLTDRELADLGLDPEAGR